MQLKKKITELLKKKYNSIRIYAHDDLDGRCAAELFTKYMQNLKIYATSITFINYRQLQTIHFNSTQHNDLYIFLDLKIDNILYKFDNYIYIDHHSKHNTIEITTTSINITTQSEQSTAKTVSELLNITTSFDVDMVNNYDAGNPLYGNTATEIYAFYKKIFGYYIAWFPNPCTNYEEINMLAKESCIYNKNKITIIDLHRYINHSTFHVITYFPDLFIQLMHSYEKLYNANCEAIIFLLSNKISARVLSDVDIDKILGIKLRGHAKARASLIETKYFETINQVKLNILKYNSQL